MGRALSEGEVYEGKMNAASVSAWIKSEHFNPSTQSGAAYSFLSSIMDSKRVRYGSGLGRALSLGQVHQMEDDIAAAEERRGHHVIGRPHVSFIIIYIDAMSSLMHMHKMAGGSPRWAHIDHGVIYYGF